MEIRLSLIEGGELATLLFSDKVFIWEYLSMAKTTREYKEIFVILLLNKWADIKCKKQIKKRIELKMTKYIIRLDDACPTMNAQKWDRVESLLDRYGIKPIVAVIPYNEDPNMLKDAEDMNFWDKVKSWQEKGWTIALHGYNHVYGTNKAGLVPFNKRSEFSGLPYEEQAKKIKDGINIFKVHGIDAKIWVAPSHSFDLNTLQALRKNSSINVVSDGVAIFPFEKFGFRWIPQQFWFFRKMPIGVWTSCFHPNEMSEKEFSRLESFLEKNHKNFTQIKNLKFKKFCILNNIFSLIYWQLRKMKEIMK